jgi:hypothetical protein
LALSKTLPCRPGISKMTQKKKEQIPVFWATNFEKKKPTTTTFTKK